MRSTSTCSFVSSAIWAICAICAIALPACGDDESGAASSQKEVDADNDGWPASLDCNDHDASIFPAADDVPGDGIDQNCSGHDGAGLGGAGGGGTGGNVG